MTWHDLSGGKFVDKEEKRKTPMVGGGGVDNCCPSQEMGIGWPLGLRNVNMRLQLAKATAATEPSHTPTSSFSSSNLDTESTTSFFRDNSKTLGRLIGLRPLQKGRDAVYLQNSTRLREPENVNSRFCHENSQKHAIEVSPKICILLCVIMCYGKDKNK
ncbi:hypothetical protein Nepgr_017665 [Nepenthes gracilis]|uniref:Uncharacterized protein n=1 Tax=Nepenthes gracilis TaxID=150966 RepID=A0AAD3XTB8_NEPGR|nr:hypothetical protein Nepgr_017665 [Nepenthes gracilis]